MREKGEVSFWKIVVNDCIVLIVLVGTVNLVEKSDGLDWAAIFGFFGTPERAVKILWIFHGFFLFQPAVWKMGVEC